MKKLTIKHIVELHEDYTQFSEEEKKLFRLAKKASEHAHVPYSHFQVGAAVLMENGQVYSGSNQENAAYPSGLCAERVTLSYAGANSPNVAVKGIAVIAQYNGDFVKELVAPCGGCRQVMAEYEHKYNHDIKIYIMGKGDRVMVVNTVKDLLPFGFSGDVFDSENASPQELRNV